MSYYGGCIGSSPIDQWIAHNADQATRAGADEEAFDKACDMYGEHLGTHPQYGEVFENGFGHPSMERDEDDLGRPTGWSLCGMSSARVYRTKTSKVLVKEVVWERGKYRAKGAFFTLIVK